MSFIKFLPRIKRQQDQISWGQLHGAALPYAIAQLVQAEPGVYLLIVPDTPSALRLEQELAVFFNDSSSEARSWKAPSN